MNMNVAIRKLIEYWGFEDPCYDCKVNEDHIIHGKPQNILSYSLSYSSKIKICYHALINLNLIKTIIHKLIFYRPCYSTITSWKKNIHVFIWHTLDKRHSLIDWSCWSSLFCKGLQFRQALSVFFYFKTVIEVF